MGIDQASKIYQNELQDMLGPLEEEANGWLESSPKNIVDPVLMEKFVGLDYGQRGVEFLDWFDVFVEYNPKEVIHSHRRRKREQRIVVQRRACFVHVDPLNQTDSSIGLCIKDSRNGLTTLPFLPYQVVYIDNERWIVFKGLVEMDDKLKAVGIRVMFYEVSEHIEIHTPDFYKNKTIPDITRLITRMS